MIYAWKDIVYLLLMIASIYVVMGYWFKMNNVMMRILLMEMVAIINALSKKDTIVSKLNVSPFVGIKF